jgi:hypothetical protein
VSDAVVDTTPAVADTLSPQVSTPGTLVTPAGGATDGTTAASVIESTTVVSPAVQVEPAVVEPAAIVPPEPVVYLTPLQHVEAWWAELKATAPAPAQKAFWVHAEEEWHKLVARLEGL